MMPRPSAPGMARSSDLRSNLLTDPRLKRSWVWRFWTLAAALLIAVAPAVTRAQSAASGPPLVIPLKVIAGKLIAIGYVTGAAPERTKSLVSYEIALDK